MFLYTFFLLHFILGIYTNYNESYSYSQSSNNNNGNIEFPISNIIIFNNDENLKILEAYSQELLDIYNSVFLKEERFESFNISTKYYYYYWLYDMDLINNDIRLFIDILKPIKCFKLLIELNKDNLKKVLNYDICDFIKDDFSFILQKLYYEIFNLQNNNYKNITIIKTYMFMLRLIFNDIIKLYYNKWHEIINMQILENIINDNKKHLSCQFYKIICQKNFTSLKLTFYNHNDLRFVELVSNIFVKNITEYNYVFNSLIYNFKSSLLIDIMINGSTFVEKLITGRLELTDKNLNICYKLIFMNLNIVISEDIPNKNQIYISLIELINLVLSIKFNITSFINYNKCYNLYIIRFLYENILNTENDMFNNKNIYELKRYIAFSMFKLYCLYFNFVKSFSVNNFFIRLGFTLDNFSNENFNDSYFNNFLDNLKKKYIDFTMYLEYLSLFVNIKNLVDFNCYNTVNFLINGYLKYENFDSKLSSNSYFNILNIFDEYLNLHDFNNQIYIKKIRNNQASILECIFSKFLLIIKYIKMKNYSKSIILYVLYQKFKNMNKAISEQLPCLIYRLDDTMNYITFIFINLINTNTSLLNITKLSDMKYLVNFLILNYNYLKENFKFLLILIFRELFYDYYNIDLLEEYCYFFRKVSYLNRNILFYNLIYNNKNEIFDFLNQEKETKSRINYYLHVNNLNF